MVCLNIFCWIFSSNYYPEDKFPTIPLFGLYRAMHPNQKDDLRVT